MGFFQASLSFNIPSRPAWLPHHTTNHIQIHLAAHSRALSGLEMLASQRYLQSTSFRALPSLQAWNGGENEEELCEGRVTTLINRSHLGPRNSGDTLLMPGL
ncbi:hypothetical protein SRHO_G00084230 [Serrasalmus rhombeus]